MRTIKTLLAFALIAGFSQAALADNASAAKAIADIVASMNHFPSDDQKAELAAVAGDDSVGRGFQMIATAVSNIQHSPTAEDKEVLDQIIASDQATAEAKTLAGVVAGFSHTASAEAKATLASLQ